MKVRSYKTDIEKLKEAGSSFVRQSAETKMIYRATIVNMYLNGISTKALSEACGESPATINLWVKLADEQGFQALKLSAPPGRPRRLSETQLDAVRDAMLSPPETHNYALWDGKSVADYINKQFNVSLSTRQCQRLIKEKLNLSLTRPKDQPSKGKSKSEKMDYHSAGESHAER